jgi:hypothetical protein
MKRVLSAAAAVSVLLVLGLSGCGSDADDSPKQSGTGGTGGGGSGVCLLNNCNSDAECDCADGRTQCKVSEHRCLACDPGGAGCPPGQICSSFGICQNPNQVCPTDGAGEPTISCSVNADCAACDPQHQLCDQAKGKCVHCTETNTSLCTPTDICVDNKCADKCPDQCTTNNDCMLCVTTDGVSAGKKAQACYNHKCSECSDSYPCPAGKVCQKGQCIQPCGLPGQTPGTCDGDADCGGCGDAPNDPTVPKWKCKFPINGGLHGACKPPAAGCADLGNGLALPAPFDQVTNTCSTDANCAGVGVNYNVGQLIRDLIGGPELNVGITKIQIKDSIVTYGMNVCASIELFDGKSCGLCVPCKVDSDCGKINVDQVVGDLFKGEALASLAAGFLIDVLYGDNDDHSLHFQCLEIAGGYGACIPCSNPTKDCGQTGGTGSGSCNHNVCDEGGPLNATCSPCAAEVCENDSFCCNTAWDSACVNEVGIYCPGGCGGTTTCTHGPCSTGTALNSQCSACVSAVCAADPYCCNTQSGSWDSTCVTEAQAESACSSECSGGCAHSECSKGGPLTSGCSSCASAICGGDAFCCTTEWDQLCVDAAVASSACNC